MSDLSWLNPTPHAIAVYASRPPSPVATQHSLPSGRYSLLGPDFHRLDRTSLRLALLFDHCVGALLELNGYIEAERLGGLEIDHQLELDRSLDGKLARLGALEDAIGIRRRAPKIIDHVISVGQQAAEFSEETVRIEGRETVASRQRCDLRAMGVQERIR